MSSGVKQPRGFGDCFPAERGTERLAMTGLGLRGRSGRLQLVIARSEATKQSRILPPTHEDRDCFAPLAMTFFGRLQLKG
jgi:hypothetical protein